MMFHLATAPLAVVPILVGPLQALLTLLPYILLGLAGLFGSIVMAVFRPWKIVRFVWTQKVALLIVAAAGVGIWFLFSHVLVTTAQVAAADKGTDWPLWRGGLDRRGYVHGSPDPVRGGVNWRFQDGATQFLSSPAVAGNRVYVASAALKVFDHNGSGDIYCFDADTGGVVWKYGSSKYRATFSSPVVSGNWLIIGEGLHETADARVICLDLGASEQVRRGVERWTFRTKSHVEASPCVAEGKVCVGAGDDGVYCFALDGDGKGQAKVLWKLDGTQFPDCETSPLLVDGRVYFGQGEEGQAITCVDAADGKLLWQVPTPYPVFGSPAIAGNRLVVAMGNGNFAKSAAELQADERARLTKAGKSSVEIDAAVKKLAPGGEVWCLDLKTHKVLWTYHLSETSLGVPVIAGERVYVGSDNGWLYCLSMAGQLMGKWDARSPIQASLVVSDDHVYAATKAGQVYVLEKESLRPVWQHDVGSRVISSPAVGRGRLYLGSESSGLICLGEPAGAKPTLWAGHLGGPGQSGWTRGSLIGERGKFLWRYPQADAAADESAAVATAVHAPPAFIGDACYVGVDEKDRHGLACLTLSKAGTTAPRQTWFCPSDNGVFLSAAADEQVVYFVDGRQGDANRRLHGVDGRTGKPLWDLAVASAASGRFFLTGRYLVIADQPGILTGFTLFDDPAHAPVPSWCLQLGDVVDTPIAVENLLVVAGKNPSRLTAIDLPTGLILWDRTIALDVMPLTGPVVVEDSLWIGASGGLYRFDLASGQPREGITGASVSTPLVTDGNHLVAVNAQGEILVIDGRGGAAPLRITGADPGQSPVLHDDLLMYFAGGNIRTCRLPAPATTMPAAKAEAAAVQSKVWCAVEWLGKPVSPMIVRGSQLYFAADKSGLVCAGMKE